MLKGIVIPTVHLAGKVGKVDPPPPPPSAPVFDALYYLEGQGNNPIEFNHTVANEANRLMLYLCGIRADVQITAATFNGDAFSKILHLTNSGDMRAEIWALLAPDTGTHQVVVTSTNNDQVKFSHTVSIYNVNQATPIKTPASDQGSGTSTSLAAVPSDIYSLVVDALSFRDGGSVTPDVAQTLRRGYSGGNLKGGVSTKPGAATSTSMAWTSNTSQPWVQLGVAVNGN